MKNRSRLWVLGAVALAAAASIQLLPGPSIHTVGAAGLSVGVPTVVDPVIGGAEPDTGVDNSNNAWITAPVGTSTQTSMFWHSLDGGQTFRRVGPGGGHWICPALGGGDSLVSMDRKNGDVWLWDQEALASLGSGVTTGDGSTLPNSSCLNTPAMTADRPFADVLDPSGAVKAPQYVATGKPISYMSWQCDACGISGGGPGGLGFAWSDDGKTWHAADPDVTVDNVIGSTLGEAGVINSYTHHGPTVIDPVTGYVFTAIACQKGCPPGAKSNTDKELGVAVGVPPCATVGPNCPTTGTNKLGNAQQFVKEYYNTASQDYKGAPWGEGESLFPVLAQGADRTLYEAWIIGSSTAATGTPPAQSWHMYYSYSSDLPYHKVWSPAQQIDAGGGTSVMGWIAAGDAHTLAAIWLNSAPRIYPSDKADGPDRPWYPHMAVSTAADSANPGWLQTQIGNSPNHLGEICLQGTICGVGSPPGNRNMADFISVDIGPDGVPQATWASDANRLSTLPTSPIPGLPVTMTARMVAGPRLRGGGTVRDSRFSMTPTTTGVTQPAGAALYPVWPHSSGKEIPQLDLTGSRLEWDGTNIRVHMTVADLSNLTSPDGPPTLQSNIWWLTTWQMHGKIYYARAKASGAAITYDAGVPGTYDRPGLSAGTSPTLIDYDRPATAATGVTGQKTGNEFVITVPAGQVGAPTTGAVLDSVTAFAILDNGTPPVIAPGVAGSPTDNVPSVISETPAYEALLDSASVVPSPPPFTRGAAVLNSGSFASVLLALLGAGLVAGVAGVALRRRRQRGVRP